MAVLLHFREAFHRGDLTTITLGARGVGDCVVDAALLLWELVRRGRGTPDRTGFAKIKSNVRGSP
jgi:hypothetical protein